MPNEYLKTVDRLEPDIHPIDPPAGWASIAVSLKRIADAMEVTAGIKPIAHVASVMLTPDAWWIGLEPAERERLVTEWNADKERDSTPTTGGTRVETVVCSNGPLEVSTVPTAWVVGQLLADAGAKVEYATTGHIRQVVITGRADVTFQPPIAIEFPLAPAFLRRPDAGAVLSPDSVATLQYLLEGWTFDVCVRHALLTRMAEKGMSDPLVRVEQLMADIGLWPRKGGGDGG